MHFLPIEFIGAIRAEFPPRFLEEFISERSELEVFGRDATRDIAPNPSAVVFPRTTEEVSKLLRLCSAHNVSVVPSGGRTGLAGGAVAANGELVLSLEKMRAIGEVDVVARTVRVEAGAITEAVHRHCEKHGLTWPVDFASKGSSQVGGNIATNAGGVRVIRYGLTRQWVLGLQVVLANGDILELNGALEKNNTGPDLRQLFIGSEGVFGVITAATLKLAPVPPPASVFLLGLSSIDAVLSLFRELRRAPLTISAFEFFTDRCAARVSRHRRLEQPLSTPTPYYVLLELEAIEFSDVEPLLQSLFEKELIVDGTFAQHAAQAAALWSLRESISESLSATGRPHKNDIALPIAELESFCIKLEKLIETQYPGWELCLFGHIGDGNLHVNIMKPDALTEHEFCEHTARVDHAIFALVAEHGGSISAEHGIGLLKKDYLRYSRSPQELALFRAIKRVFDSKNILNPGKIIDL